MPVPDPQGGAQLRSRKNSHLDLCETGPVEYLGKTTLFEEVDFLHNSLPELAADEIDTRTEFVGKTMRAPLLITGMTGGTDEAFEVNRDLAIVAERTGIAIGLGSQRVMQRDPSTAWTFEVRKYAPTAPLLANIGVNQAVEQTTKQVRALVRQVDADALCVHLNPAQELIQPEGDRSFRGGLEAIKRLCGELDVPVIAKETGCGISPAVAHRLRKIGVRCIDVSGAGGTSWVRVEMLRGDADSRALGELFSEWGIPTAASIALLKGQSLELIASGGIRNGLEIAKAIALGASVAGTALPIYRAYRSAGIDAAAKLVDQLVTGLRTTMVLTGSSDLAALRKQPLVIGDRLQSWLRAGEKTVRRRGKERSI